ncbi:hypothetical protein ILUMI_01467 [Ignelater luminosus]|uniref:Integrase catalytic domain-containing protein n=1 Tax=Ignelater luminosus TaxID=2038154 RepID=A0A8K0DIH3_IGNLU|nr:hypothetical protein ILUMI_01467 [Ignelater luminosus]
MWTYRILKTPWTDRVPNEEVLRRVGRNRQLLTSTKRRKLEYQVHILRNDKYNLLQLILNGKIEGKHRIGRKTMSWLWNLRHWTGMSAGDLIVVSRDVAFNEELKSKEKRLNLDLEIDEANEEEHKDCNEDVAFNEEVKSKEKRLNLDLEIDEANEEEHKDCNEQFQALEAPSEGPFEDKQRDPKYFTLRIKDKDVAVSIDRLKPAYLKSDQVVYEANSEQSTSTKPKVSQPLIPQQEENELSVDCGYSGEMLAIQLRDRFATGLNHKGLEIELKQRWTELKAVEKGEEREVHFASRLVHASVYDDESKIERVWDLETVGIKDDRRYQVAPLKERDEDTMTLPRLELKAGPDATFYPKFYLCSQNGQSRRWKFACLHNYVLITFCLRFLFNFVDSAAVLLAARLQHFLRKVLTIKISETVCWTDLQITIHWIKGDPSNWKPYVANRLREIQTLTNNTQGWYHCPGSDNPADLLTRGITANVLIQSKLYDILNVRVVAYMLRFLNNAKRKRDKTVGDLTSDELEAFELHLRKQCQCHEYAKKIPYLKGCGVIKHDSNVLTLNPFLDDIGLLCVGGRLQNHYGDYNVKHPVTLRGAIPFAPLPKDCITKAKAFQATGLDFAGPLYVKENKREKVYIFLFTCAVTRAIHLELVSNLNTETSLLALGEFMARRGVPQIIYSDNAKTFKRLAGDFQELSNIMESEDIRRLATNFRIKWKFILERAAWWGGFWESLVRNVKTALKASVGRFLLNRDQSSTLITEIEAKINGRPLTYITDDHDELLPLTPSHVLIGYGETTVPQILRKADGNELRKQRRQRMQAMDHF